MRIMERKNNLLDSYDRLVEEWYGNFARINGVPSN